jgi:hypothetical protein
MSVFELSLWMNPCIGNPNSKCNTDMAFFVASTLEELISEGM